MSEVSGSFQPSGEKGVIRLRTKDGTFASFQRQGDSSRTMGEIFPELFRAGESLTTSYMGLLTSN